MEQIVQKVREVTALIEKISTASGEQISGIEQVNNAVGSLDDATQQNARMVQESTEAARALQERANRLADAIRVFKASA
jgi:methyl-accepting chemotaxis protein